MALTVQTQQGSVQSANAYAGLELMKSFHADRGVDLSTYTDERLSQALVRATDFLDSRYSFIGYQLLGTQGTECPRYLDNDGARDYRRDIHTLEPAYLLTTTQWTRLLQACCQLAYRDLTKVNGLMPDPVFDASGQKVSKKTTKAGPIEKSIEYEASRPGVSDANVPSYPAVDLLLKNAGLLRGRSGGTIERG